MIIIGILLINVVSISARFLMHFRIEIAQLHVDRFPPKIILRNTSTILRILIQVINEVDGETLASAPAFADTGEHCVTSHYCLVRVTDTISAGGKLYREK